jgi:hypothetical protein
MIGAIVRDLASAFPAASLDSASADRQRLQT